MLYLAQASRLGRTPKSLVDSTESLVRTNHSNTQESQMKLIEYADSDEDINSNTGQRPVAKEAVDNRKAPSLKKSSHPLVSKPLSPYETEVNHAYEVLGLLDTSIDTELDLKHVKCIASEYIEAFPHEKDRFLGAFTVVCQYQKTKFGTFNQRERTVLTPKFAGNSQKRKRRPFLESSSDEDSPPRHSPPRTEKSINKPKPPSYRASNGVQTSVAPVKLPEPTKSRSDKQTAELHEYVAKKDKCDPDQGVRQTPLTFGVVDEGKEREELVHDGSPKSISQHFGRKDHAPGPANVKTSKNSLIHSNGEERVVSQPMSLQERFSSDNDQGSRKRKIANVSSSTNGDPPPPKRIMLGSNKDEQVANNQPPGPSIPSPSLQVHKKGVPADNEGQSKAGKRPSIHGKATEPQVNHTTSGSKLNQPGHSSVQQSSSGDIANGLDATKLPAARAQSGELKTSRLERNQSITSQKTLVPTTKEIVDPSSGKKDPVEAGTSIPNSKLTRSSNGTTKPSLRGPGAVPKSIAKPSSDPFPGLLALAEGRSMQETSKPDKYATLLRRGKTANNVGTARVTTSKVTNESSNSVVSSIRSSPASRLSSEKSPATILSRPHKEIEDVSRSKERPSNGILSAEPSSGNALDSSLGDQSAKQGDTKRAPALQTKSGDTTSSENKRRKLDPSSDLSSKHSPAATPKVKNSNVPGDPTGVDGQRSVPGKLGPAGKTNGLATTTNLSKLDKLKQKRNERIIGSTEVASLTKTVSPTPTTKQHDNKLEVSRARETGRITEDNNVSNRPTASASHNHAESSKVLPSMSTPKIPQTKVDDPKMSENSKVLGRSSPTKASTATTTQAISPERCDKSESFCDSEVTSHPTKASHAFQPDALPPSLASSKPAKKVVESDVHNLEVSEPEKFAPVHKSTKTDRPFESPRNAPEQAVSSPHTSPGRFKDSGPVIQPAQITSVVKKILPSADSQTRDLDLQLAKVDLPSTFSESVPVIKLSNVLPEPKDKEAEPYFEFSLFEKLWSDDDNESDVRPKQALGYLRTCVEAANRQAEDYFRGTLTQQCNALFLKTISTESMRSVEDDCMTFSATLVGIDIPSRKLYLKVGVQRRFVDAATASMHPPEYETRFVSKNMYMVHLYRLVENPGWEQNVDPDMETAPSSTESTSSSCSSDSDQPSSSPSKNLFAKARKQREARKLEQKQKDKPRDKRKNIEPPYLRIHTWPLPKGRTEAYTTLDAANSAALGVQIDMSHDSNATGTNLMWQAQNLAALRRRLEEMKKKDGGDGKGRDEEESEDGEDEDEEGNEGECVKSGERVGKYWKSEFNEGKLGGSKFEVVVRRIGITGPRNG